MQRGVLGKPWCRVLTILALVAVALAQPCLFAQEKGIAGVTKGTVKAERSRRWAVLVGINDYEDQEGIGNLKYAADDVQLMYDCLTGPGGGYRPRNVILMTERANVRKRKPTRANIVTTLRVLMRRARPGDDFLFAFSGHGVEEHGVVYLVPSDGMKDNLADTGISLDLIVRRLLRECKADRKVLILDCCRRVAGKGAGSSIDEMRKTWKEGKGLVVLNSCGSGETSHEDDAFKHGVFTHFLVDGLRGRADGVRGKKDGRVTADEAYLYSQNAVLDWATRHLVRQEPTKDEKEVRGLITLTYGSGVRIEDAGAGKIDARKVSEAKRKLRRLQSIQLMDTDFDAAKLYDESKRYTPQKKIAHWKAFGAKFAGQDFYDKGAYVTARIAHWQEALSGPKRPGGWTSQTRRVKVATPSGEQWKQITYYTNSIGIEFVLVPAGEFMMGSRDPASQVAARCGGYDAKDKWFTNEHPRHRVRITRAFFIGAHEVTQRQYERVMGKNPAHFKGANNPVEQVSWNDAAEFCRRLSQKDGATYRLPTESEWEYACRAGTTTPFHTGETISTGQANYDGNYWYANGTKGQYRRKTTPVGSFAANAWGLYDMHGNVWEWCQDWYDDDYYSNSPTDDPTGPATGKYLVLRGGSWFYFPYFMRSAYRLRGNPAFRNFNIGLRVVVSSQ